MAISTLASLFILALATESPTPTACLAAFSTEGLDAAATSATRARLVTEILAAGGSVVELSKQPATDCLDVPACLRQVTASSNIAVVLDVRVLRVGSLVRVAVRVLDARDGEALVEKASMLKAAGFPSSLEIHDDLALAFGKLAAKHPPAPPDVVATPVVPPAPASAPAEPAAPTTRAAVAPETAFNPWPVVGLVVAGTGALLGTAGGLALGVGLWKRAEYLQQVSSDGALQPGHESEGKQLLNNYNNTLLLLNGGRAVAVVGLAMAGAGFAVWLVSTVAQPDADTGAP